MAYGLGMTRLIDTSLKTALWSGHVEGKTCTVWPWRCRARFLYMRGTEKYLRKKIIIIINVSIFFQVYFIAESFLSWNTGSHCTEWVSSICNLGNTIKCCIYRQGLWGTGGLNCLTLTNQPFISKTPSETPGLLTPSQGFFFFSSLENMNNFTKNRYSCFS